MNIKQRIAIVGIGGVFPGAHVLDQFWDNIVDARDLSREPPPGRWLLPLAEIWHSRQAPDKVYSRRACFVNEFPVDLDGLDIDRAFFESLDHMYRLLLHAGKAAWFDAVTTDIDRERAGVIIGNIALPTDAASNLADEIYLPLIESQLFDRPVDTGITINPLNRYVTGLPAGLLARALGLGGGSYTLDAACASSLYALKYAVDELIFGRADIMLAGGLSRPDSLYTQMGFSALTALSASGRCAPFDHRADGLVVGEGCGMVVLKRLEDAINANDHIYALITGIGLSNDIGGNLMAPDSEGQLRAMHSAYEQAQWQPDTVDLIECHGTGTPVGDAVEFNSLLSLWNGYTANDRCVIGSVKSNIGHLLTAAGAAGLLKVLLAMKHQRLPPTANFEAAPDKIDLANSPFTVLDRAIEWRSYKTGVPRRAAISAFGFGGINAHVLLEEWKEGNDAAHIPAPQRRHDEDIAVIGMDACFGSWKSLTEFRDRVLNRHVMNDVSPSVPTAWWGKYLEHGISGWFMDEVSIPVGRFRIPPTELKDMLPQQLLMLQVAANALGDAGISSDMSMLNTGVYIGIGLDLNTTNFHLRWKLSQKARKWSRHIDPDMDDNACSQWVTELCEMAGPSLSANRTMGALGGIVASRIARAFNMGGPSFTVSSEEASGLRSLTSGVRALQRNEIDIAVTGAVDLAGDIRSVLGQDSARSLNNSANSKAVSGHPEDLILGEGAAALILKRHADAVRDGNRIYTLIKGVGEAVGGGIGEHIPSASAYRSAMESSMETAGASIDSIGYLELHGGGYPREDKLELDAVTELFAQREYAIPLALGNCKADIGHAGAAGGAAALVKACLCLYHSTLPALRSHAAFAEVSNPQALSTPTQSQYWLRNRKDGPRHAMVNTFSIDGNYISAVLEGVDVREDAVYAGCDYPQELFTVAADDEQALLTQLQRLKKNISPSAELRPQAAQWWREQQHNTDHPAAISLLAATGDELSNLIQQAGNAIRENRQVIGDKIFYSPLSRGQSDKVAFVFPGSGNHFQGMGREAALFMNNVLNRLDSENGFLAGQFADGRFWFGEGKSPYSHEDLIFGQVWLGTLMSDIVTGFGVRPDAVIGYSLGETAGLFATRTWTERDLMLRRIRNSTLFTRDLAGPCNAVSTVWGLEPGQTVDWQVGMIDRGAAEVSKAVAGTPRVYLLIINTPDECVIGGDRASVLKLVEDLKCNFHPVTGVTTVHCEVAGPVAQAYRDLHLFRTTPPLGVTFYSGIRGGTYEVTRDSAADSILGQALHYFDYTRVINSAWDDGVRIFIEMGPGATCTRMIDRILAHRPHIATALCLKGQSETFAVLRLLAQLHAERIPVDLSCLYRDEPETDPYANGQKIIVPVGRKSLVVPLPRDKVKVESEKWKGSVSQVRSHEIHTEPLAPRPSPLTTSTISPETYSREDVFNEILQQAAVTETAHAETQAQFLKVANGFNEILSELQSIQSTLIQSLPAGTPELSLTKPGRGVRGEGREKTLLQSHSASSEPLAPRPSPLSPHPSPLYTRAQCIEFATGSIGKVLGPEFAAADSFPTRVRLPDEPLMLVDRIIEVEGEPASMTRGRVLTEHDIHPGAWYLDCGRIPTCIAVEAGQADLFLSAYLGIDLHTRGLAMYRLLDAEVTFHAPLPAADRTIQYDIHIDRFFRQGNTWLFRFRFDGSVDGRPLITMRNGCAGFFTPADLDAGRGIVLTSIEQQPQPGNRPREWKNPVAMHRESYSDAQIDALRDGRLGDCFGADFAGMVLQNPMGLPGGRMSLVHRILDLDPTGGRFGIGQITGEADIHPNDWFLTCHFVDDQVMPGTLMYECCLHTLRIYLLRMGWVGEAHEFVYEPLPGMNSKLKCRGQVTAATSRVQYEITLKEYGYQDDGTPYVIADAIMNADGRSIVQMTGMSLLLSGLSKQRIEEIWRKVDNGGKPIFDHDSILAFATGRPSAAFGGRYRIFDEKRVIARLPGPPFQFLDRIIAIDNCRQWELVAGGVIEAEYDVPVDAWYFRENRQPFMPYSVLLEAALQPCGWLAAYLGSALCSDQDLSFRNLGGEGVQHRMVTPQSGTLCTRVKITSVSRSGGMIIQHFDFQVRNDKGAVYEGNTYFGFFTKDALANQVGIRDAQPYRPTPEEISHGLKFMFPDQAPYPGAMMRMVDDIELFDPEGGPEKLGFISGTARVDPGAWFFKAHFYQDPVWPGSLGLESLIQLLKAVAVHHWKGSTADLVFESMGLGKKHQWIYRGQILPENHNVGVQAVIKRLNHKEKALTADGYLSVDGRIIYQMTGFTLKLNA